MSKLKPAVRRLIIILAVILLIVAVYMLFIRVHIKHDPENHGDLYTLLKENNWENCWGDTTGFSEDGEYYCYDGGGSPAGTADLTPNYTFDEKNRSIRIFGNIFLFNSKKMITYIDPHFLVLTDSLPYTESLMTYNPDFPDSVQYGLEDNWIFVQIHKLNDGKITIAPYDHIDGNAETARYITELTLRSNWKCYQADADDYGKEAKELPLLSGDERKALIKEQSTAFVRFNFRGKITDVVFFDMAK